MGGCCARAIRRFLSAEEIKNFFQDAYLGDVVNDRTLGAIIDMADANGDDGIDYFELSKVIECDDIVELLALVPAVALAQHLHELAVGKRGATAGVTFVCSLFADL